MDDALATTLPRVAHGTYRRRFGAGPSADLKPFIARVRIAEAARCEPWRQGNAVDLLIDGEQTFDAMFAAMAAARHSILLETYILEAAGPGQRLAELLAQKCAQGVDVRVMFDSLGSFGTERAYFEALAAHGVRVREFNPVRPWHTRFAWIFNQRTHRKLLIVDHEVAFIGGVNFSDVYSGGSASAQRDAALAKRPWRDTHARLRGPIVGDLQALFFEHWVEQGGASLASQRRSDTRAGLGLAGTRGQRGRKSAQSSLSRASRDAAHRDEAHPDHNRLFRADTTPGARTQARRGPWRPRRVDGSVRIRLMVRRARGTQPLW